MLATVTLNAAIDKTYRLPRLSPGQLHRTKEHLSLPGGKGINVARVARALGTDVIATGFVAGHNGRFIAEGCAKAGIAPAFVETEGESRCCLTFLDEETGEVTEVLEQGPVISDRAFAHLQGKLSHLARQATFVSFSGSMPAGVPVDGYHTLIDLVRQSGALPVLDASGTALVHGLKAKPYLVKPNRDEAQVLLGYELNCEGAVIQALHDIHSLGAKSVLLSMGEQGAWFSTGDTRWHFPAVQVEKAVNPVGCGDALLAGIIAGKLKGLDWEAAVQMGMASAAANVISIGAGMVDPDVVEELLRLPVQPKQIGSG
ncbi:1-phosphofructokinase family hexose kinase [Brevibacillus choshinensis]|uniref:Tagatose-6-phosphate kinase n=1 Tax=Brevibacillus choshinensis TaxID=54911 RepID=A0ABX7FLM4_BRECH|nr:1-phosphofructokinase family hexose kinase [Brevibacillus choshinensis]QRG66545.1 1-phosphofructokinase family hexose kinase [Brevibacillus choshinensis]